MSANKKIDKDAIASLKSRIQVAQLIGEDIVLEKDGDHEYTALCAFHDECTPSFRVYPDKSGGHYHCFGCGAHGDAVDWLMEYRRFSFYGALRHLKDTTQSEIALGEIGSIERPQDWLPIVPDGAPPLMLKTGWTTRIFNPKREGTERQWSTYRPSLVHPYRNTQGALLGYVLRVDFQSGKKFTPCVCFCRHAKTGELRWCIVSFSKPRPLYRLNELVSRPRSAVLLVEGEKTADAAQKLLPMVVATTWPGGSKAYHLCDFTPLRGRKVVGVPDADAEGRDAFDGRTTARGKRVPGIIQLLSNIGVDARRVDPPADLPRGWDLADALKEGWDTARTLSWIRANLTRLSDAA